MQLRDSERSEQQPVKPGTLRFAANRFDRMEWAGAFGDLGTLIPFVVAYVSLLKIEPLGVLFTFGIAMMVSGIYYKTPFPVQPMKAIGAIATTQAAQTIVLTQNMVYAAGLVTGLVWLLLGVTGLARRVANLVSRPVTLGIILGLGFSFMLDGIRMIATGWLLGGVGLLGTLLLLKSRTIPAMLVLLAFGVLAALFQDPDLLSQLAQVKIGFRLPEWSLGTMTWNDLLIGAVFLALPQVPLTLGNAVIAVTDENNRLFPERKVTEQGVAVSTGVLNLFAAPLGGIPMCHGAGGMAGHVRFGARTGGALVILGGVLLLVALFFSGSIATVLRIFPQPILGVILFLTGGQLALGTCYDKWSKGERFVMYTTAAFAMYNVGIAFVFGTLLYWLLKRRHVTL